MAAFNYRALDPNGKASAGVVEADSGRGARQLLRQRGLHPLAVDEVGHRTAGRAPRRRLKSADLCLLTRQWSTLLASGLTMEESLSALIEQAENEAMRQTLAGLRADILAGYSLRAALERCGGAFSPLYRASVAAGEKSGQLARVMVQLADYLERRDALQRKTLQALLYPAIVAGVALLVVVGLMIYVVPQVVGVFQQGRQALPPLTRGLIALSAFLRDWGGLLLAAGLAGGIGLRLALRAEAARRAWDSRLLRLPGLGRHLAALDATRFASTLAILVGSGVPLLAALDAGRQVMTRLPLQEAVRDAADRVREGLPLARALGRSRAFPPLLIHMIASGEATGQLDALLERAAGLQQAQLENRTALLTTLLEPALLLGMGGAVLLIVLAVMQPIIEINHLMR